MISSRIVQPLPHSSRLSRRSKRAISRLPISHCGLLRPSAIRNPQSAHSPQCYTCDMRFRRADQPPTRSSRQPLPAPPGRARVGHRADCKLPRPKSGCNCWPVLGIDNVRIRGASAGDEPKIENRGTDADPAITSSASSPPAKSCAFPAAPSAPPTGKARRLLRPALGRWGRRHHRTARPLRPHRKATHRRACRSCPTDRLCHQGPTAASGARSSANEVRAQVSPRRRRRASDPRSRARSRMMSTVLPPAPAWRSCSASDGLAFGPRNRRPTGRTRHRPDRANGRQHLANRLGSQIARRRSRRRCWSSSTSRSTATPSKKQSNAMRPANQLPIYWDHAASPFKIDPAHQGPASHERAPTTSASSTASWPKPASQANSASTKPARRFSGSQNDFLASFAPSRLCSQPSGGVAQVSAQRRKGAETPRGEESEQVV